MPRGRRVRVLRRIPLRFRPMALEYLDTPRPISPIFLNRSRTRIRQASRAKAWESPTSQIAPEVSWASHSSRCAVPVRLPIAKASAPFLRQPAIRPRNRSALQRQFLPKAHRSRAADSPQLNRYQPHLPCERAPRKSFRPPEFLPEFDSSRARRSTVASRKRWLSYRSFPKS